MRKRLLSNYTYENLKNLKKISITKKLSTEELKNLKYINTKATIELENDNYQNIKEIIFELKKIKLSNKIVIGIKNKEKFNHWLLSNTLNTTNIFIKVDFEEVSLKDYLKYEKKLYEIVEKVKKLSPFERYIYFYNITKKFKNYKENEEDKRQSRNLYSILENEFMVCVGFSKMFGDLLTKSEIENSIISVNVDVSYDKAYFNEEKEVIEKSTKSVGHSRIYTHIVDEKYGIEGFYLSDPTWDNNLEHDFYNHLVLTNNEATNSIRYLFINDKNTSELLNIESIQEFYQKINFLLDRNNSSLNYKKLKDVIEDLINKEILPLDSQYVKKIKNKYPFINEYNWPNDITELIYELGIYILDHVNKEISGEIIMEAVENVYKKAYGYSEQQGKIKIASIIEENRIRQEQQFPKRYKINENGIKEVIMNDKNKFDLKQNIKKLKHKRRK